MHPLIRTLRYSALLLVLLSWSPYSYAQLFTNIAFSEGIIHTYIPGSYGGGVSFVDFDNDGLDDITLAQKSSPVVFLKNLGPGFLPINNLIQLSEEVKQINWVDYDNDGDNDLFLTCYKGPFKLYQNNGNFQFTDVTQSAGFPITAFETFGNSWADYDRDGDLDVYIANYNGPGFGDPTIQNLLYRNNGNGTFTDITAIAGVGNNNHYSFSGFWMDYNQDLWPDLLVINDRYECPNTLYHNNGDGTFTDISVSSGMQLFIFGMGVNSADFDRDGDPDYYITNGTDGNIMHRNNGDGTFTQVASQVGAILNLFTWGAQFIDYDNDGWEDLHVCATPHISLNGQNRLLRNNGGTFTNVTAAAGIAAELAFSYGSAMGDLNADGFPDLVVLNGSLGYTSIWKNNSSANNWLKVKPVGTISNKDGVSSWIECYVNGVKHMRYTQCGESYLSQNSKSEFFGLAQQPMADSIIIRWPSGMVDKWYNIPANQHLNLVEGQGRKVELNYSNEALICEGESIDLYAGDWSAILWSTNQSAPQISITTSGAYHALATDQFGNRFLSDTLQVMVSPMPSIVAATVEPTCFGSADGMIYLQDISAETVDYTLYWPDLETSEFLLDNLSAGIYWMVIENPDGCIRQEMTVLNQPELLQANALTESIACNGNQSGSAAFDITGGTSPYSVFDSGIDWENLAAGEYQAEIIDANGCNVFVNFEITEPEILQIDLSIQHQTEPGLSNGSAAIIIAGGTPPYQITWSNGITGATSISSLEPNLYSVAVTDANQCEVLAHFQINVADFVEPLMSERQLIYPNPATDFVIIEAPNSITELIIFDAQGRQILIHKALKRPLRIDTSEWSDGIYIIQLTGTDANQKNKLVISH